MEYRFLGRSGLKVSAISLGGWFVSIPPLPPPDGGAADADGHGHGHRLTYGGHVNEERAFECLRTAYNHGINFFDTAEGYGGGACESVMGRAIARFGWKRCDIVVSTKINFGAANSAHKARSQNTVGLSRKHVIEGLRASLARLGLDYVDLVYAHRPDRHTPVEEIVRAFNHVIDRGWAFYWGTSEWAAHEIADAWRVADRLGLVGPVVRSPPSSHFLSFPFASPPPTPPLSLPCPSSPFPALPPSPPRP